MNTKFCLKVVSFRKDVAAPIYYSALVRCSKLRKEYKLGEITEGHAGLPLFAYNPKALIHRKDPLLKDPLYFCFAEAYSSSSLHQEEDRALLLCEIDQKDIFYGALNALVYDELEYYENLTIEKIAEEVKNNPDPLFRNETKNNVILVNKVKPVKLLDIHCDCAELHGELVNLGILG